MNKISVEGWKAWKNVVTIDDVYAWHRAFTPFFNDDFIRNYLIPQYERYGKGIEEHDREYEEEEEEENDQNTKTSSQIKFEEFPHNEFSDLFLKSR